MVKMTEGMNIPERKVILFTELVKPEIRCVSLLAPDENLMLSPPKLFISSLLLGVSLLSSNSSIISVCTPLSMFYRHNVCLNTDMALASIRIVFLYLLLLMYHLEAVSKTQQRIHLK